MFDTEPSSHRAFLAQRELAFDAAVANGDIARFVYPWDTLPAGILVLAVLVLPWFGSRSARWLSYTAFLLIVLSCISVIKRCRSLGMVSGYGIGLMCVWGIVWSAVLLVYNDPRTAFKRVEWRDEKENLTETSGSKGSKTENTPEGSLRNRRAYGVVGGAHEAKQTDENVKEAAQASRRILVWQSCPEKAQHRLDWVLDLCTSFRGAGWNWHIPTLPEVDYPSPTMTPSPRSSTKLLVRIVIRDFLIWYLVVDIVKTAAMNDRYFWGIAPITSPAPEVFYLPSIITNHQHLVKLYRLLLSLSAVVSALSLIFSLCPLFFAFLLPLLGLLEITRAPLLEPWLYPPYWGPFADSVLDKGLAGWWGKWWHQIFRMGMSEPSRFLIEKFGWNPRGQNAKVLQTFVAFGISGSIHAGASYTTFSPLTRPLSGPFLFFILQAVGILAEQFVFKTMGLSNVLKSWPRTLRRVGTITYIMTWFYLTGPFLTDDFARCGIWLFEPIPVSFFRGLGFGAEGHGWWCWQGTWATLASGKETTPWWRKGFAI